MSVGKSPLALGFTYSASAASAASIAACKRSTRACSSGWISLSFEISLLRTLISAWYSSFCILMQASNSSFFSSSLARALNSLMDCSALAMASSAVFI